MSARLLVHARRNAIAYVALFVALSGTAWAATALPRGSVGRAQLRTAAVTGVKVKDDSLTGKDVRESTLGRVPRARRADEAATATRAGSAARATLADDATALGGQAASAYLRTTGKAADAERLDGIDSAVFGTTVTVSGMNFAARDEAVATARIYQGTGSVSCTGTPQDFTYRVQLPQGASVTGLDFRYLDNDGVFNANLALIAFDALEQTTALTVTVVSADTDSASAAHRTVSAAPSTAHVVDNTRYSYQLTWTPTSCAGTTQLIGAAVRYAMPTG